VALVRDLAMNRLTQFLWTYLMTAIFYAVLSSLSARRIDPVRLVSPLRQAELAFRQHGKPELSVIGVVAWFVVVLIYIAVIRLPFAGHDRTARRTAVALCITVIMVVFIHPLLAPLLMPPGWRTPYVQFLESVRVPVGPARIGLNLVALFTAISLVQAVVVFRILQLPETSHGRLRQQ
jgi:hypothetical protein